MLVKEKIYEEGGRLKIYSGLGLYISLSDIW